MNLLIIILLSLETIAAATTITATTIIIINAAEEVDRRIIIIITRIITIIVIKTVEIREHRTIGIVAEVEDRVPSQDPLRMRVALDHQHSSNSLLLKRKQQQRHRGNKVMSLQSIHVGKSHLRLRKSNSINKMIAIVDDQVALVENGISELLVAAKLITQFRYHVTNVLNRSYSVPLIRASILTNTKTFPWRRRDSKFLKTFHHSMTSS